VERTTRIRVLVGTTAVALVAAAGGYGLSSLLESPAERLARADAPKASLITATVKVGVLDAPPPIAGDVAWRATYEVTVEPTGPERPVVTALPKPVGTQLQAGQVLAEVADRPVFVLPGRIPLLRDLHVGDEGPDVARLQVALRAAGHIVDDDGVFGGATAAAITEAYERAGYQAPTEVATEDESPEVDQSQDSRQGRASLAATLPATPRLVVPASEWVFVPVLPAFVTELPVSVGTDVAGPIAQLSVGKPVVHAQFPATDKPRVGDHVTLQSRRGQGRWTGDVTSVGRTQATAGGALVPVTITPSAALRFALVGTRVDVTAAAQQRHSGLLVPISAVYAAADGSLTVHKLVDGEQEIVEVRVRNTSGGSARVSPAIRGELTKGDQVVIGVAS
jgi:peptidoglycan hydrolase-like protein with peptidoglycan-binding domain